MDYYLDKRSEEVLQLLLYANHYITVNEIATHLNVSKRTIYYEINKINSWFSNNGIPPIVSKGKKESSLQKINAPFSARNTILSSQHLSYSLLRRDTTQRSA